MKPGLAILPLEVWADVFEHPMITRQEMAQIADNNGDPNFTNKLQKLLHECGKHSLHSLQISKRPFESSKSNQLQKQKVPAYQASLAVARDSGSFCFGHWIGPKYEKCEFPVCEMPENIKKFKRLTIGYLDDQVLDFLIKLKPLFNNVILDIQEIESARHMHILFGHLLPMLGSIRTIKCSNFYLGPLEQFPRTLALAKELHLPKAYLTSIPEYINWLTATAPKQHFIQHEPRLLKTAADFGTINAIVEAVRKQFMAAATSATFVIFLDFYWQEEKHNRVDEFHLENATTNEELTVRKLTYHKRNNYYVEIMRYPIGIEQRAYYETKFYNYDDEAEQQLISIDGPLIGRITKQAEDNSANLGDNNHADGPSTSAKGK